MEGNFRNTVKKTAGIYAGLLRGKLKYRCIRMFENQEPQFTCKNSISFRVRVKEDPYNVV